MIDRIERLFPVVEVFGPTIQGEGPDAGRPCWFVRLGGCDFRCSWCDSMHAVDPAQVRAAPLLTADDIMGRLDELGAGDGAYIVLSGGNPALHHLDPLIDRLDMRATIAVETQGTIYRDWLRRVSRLIVSPKPPSSGMVSDRHAHQLDQFMGKAIAHHRRSLVPTMALKIVVANDVDYRWAQTVHGRWPEVPFYLSVCTPTPMPANWDDDTIRLAIGDRYGWLAERVAHDPQMADAVVLPQLHVIAWGTRMGV